MNEKYIWDFVLNETHNEYGAAAIMGNLMAESSLNPKCVTGDKDPDYVSKADNGSIDFIHDGHAFGLVQWCYWSRKQALYDFAKSRGVSVGDISMQLEHMCTEMREHYKTAWNAVVNATDIRTASDTVMLKYEKPANTGEAAKMKRANYAQKYYDQFSSDAPSADVKYVVTIHDRVNIRSGNSTNYTKLGRAENTGEKFEWVATSENNWHAIKYKDQVAWISGEFTKVEI